jgi:hypothetical protein
VTPLPLADAQARLGRPGRPRKHPPKTLMDGDRTVTSRPEIRIDSGPQGRPLAHQASALLPRLLTVKAAAKYLSLGEDTVLELLDAGTFRRVTIPAPVTAKRRGGAIRRVLLDRLQLDEAIAGWSRA